MSALNSPPNRNTFWLTFSLSVEPAFYLIRFAAHSIQGLNGSESNLNFVTQITAKRLKIAKLWRLHGSWRRFRMAHKKALSREGKVSWAGGAQSRGGLLSGVALRAIRFTLIIRFTLGDTQSATGQYCVTYMRTLQGTVLSGTEKETLWCPIPKYQLWVQVDHETPFLMFTSSLVVDQWKQWLLYLFVGPLSL